MTHDELLERLDDLKYPIGDSFNEEYKATEALRAVVELHKPMYIETEGGEFQLCEDCSRRVARPGYGVMYPCPTIQAIEKELQ